MARSGEPYDVVVVGSCMIDLVCYAPRLPRNAETLIGSKFIIAFGGKGCNQCVAAKKLKGKCLLVSRIGNDSFGRNYFKRIGEYGIPRDYVKMTEGVSTGLAQITVAETGENHIVVIPGANEKMTEGDVVEAKSHIINCKVLICQLEVPEACTIKALDIKAKGKIGTSILNAAPVKGNMNPLLYSLPDIFCVNEVEAEILTGVKIRDAKDVDNALANLLAKGCKKVFITLGEHGSVFGQRGSTEFLHVPAYPVKAIDTSGAGDAFMGSLAFFLASRPDITVRELLEKANHVASVSVMRSGTQESFPEIDDLL